MAGSLAAVGESGVGVAGRGLAAAVGESGVGVAGRGLAAALGENGVGVPGRGLTPAVGGCGVGVTGRGLAAALGQCGVGDSVGRRGVAIATRRAGEQERTQCLAGVEQRPPGRGVGGRVEAMLVQPRTHAGLVGELVAAFAVARSRSCSGDRGGVVRR